MKTSKMFKLIGLISFLGLTITTLAVASGTTPPISKCVCVGVSKDPQIAIYPPPCIEKEVPSQKMMECADCKKACSEEFGRGLKGYRFVKSFPGQTTPMRICNEGKCDGK